MKEFMRRCAVAISTRGALLPAFTGVGWRGDVLETIEVGTIRAVSAK